MNKKALYVGGAGAVVAINPDNGSVIWKTELKPGWFKGANQFVCLIEEDHVLYAFHRGSLYKIDKQTGEKLMTGPTIKPLKHAAGIFAMEPYGATTGAFVMGIGAEDGGDDGGGDGGD